MLQTRTMREHDTNRPAAEAECIIEDTAHGKRYIKGKKLGKGGFATCFEMREEATGKIYAGKFVLKSTLVKPKAKQKLTNEIKIHRSVNHPNVVRFHQCFEDREYVYIILELCDNKSFMELLHKRRRLTEPETQYYMQQLVHAVNYLHKNNIIHRDLKLGNLFINDKMEMKMGDFGLATTLAYPGERKHTICGTPNYIAPEMIDGKGEHGAEVDIWSMGVIMFTFLFGKPPFETSDVKTTYKRIRGLTYSFPENVHVSEHAKNLIRSMLSLTPCTRPSLKDIIAHPFFKMGTIPRTIPTSALTSAPSFNSAVVSAHLLKSSFPTAITHVPTPIPFHGYNMDDDMDKENGRVNQENGTAQYGTEIQGLRMSGRAPVDEVETLKMADMDIRESVRLRGEMACNPAGPAVSQHPPTSTQPNAIVAPRLFLHNPQPNNIADEARSQQQPGLRSSGSYVAQNVVPQSCPQTFGPALPYTHTASAAPPTAQTAYSNSGSSSNTCNGSKGSSTATSSENNSKETNPRLGARPRSKTCGDLGNINAVHGATAIAQVPAQAPATTRPTGGASGKDAFEGAVDANADGELMEDGQELDEDDRCNLTYMHQKLAAGMEQMASPVKAQIFRMREKEEREKMRTTLWLNKWVDYSNKYGLGYQLSDGIFGVYFNDTTKIVLHSDDVHFDYIPYHSSQTPDSRETYSLLSHPQSLQKKVTLLKYFKNYLIEHSAAPSSNTDPKPVEPRDGESNAPVYVKKWMRTKHAIIFRLSNRNVQVNFFDHTKVILSSEGQIVTYINKKREMNTYSISSVSREQTPDLVSRLKYTKDVLYRLIHK